MTIDLFTAKDTITFEELMEWSNRKRTIKERIEDFFWRIKYSLDEFFYQVKARYQRATRGYSDRDIWNLNTTFSEFAALRLKVFRKDLHGSPADLTPKQWDKILRQMQEAFELDAKEFEDLDNVSYKKRRKKIDRGLLLFALYYKHLWD